MKLIMPIPTTDMRQVLTHTGLTAPPCVCGGRVTGRADVVSGCPVEHHKALPVWIHQNPLCFLPDVGEFQEGSFAGSLRPAALLLLYAFSVLTVSAYS
jgi:hypothetical protein